MEELKIAVNAIRMDSSPGLDGFGSCFFMECRDIIKEDLVEVATEVFQANILKRFYSASYIVFFFLRKNLLYSVDTKR